MHFMFLIVLKIFLALHTEHFRYSCNFYTRLFCLR